MDLRRILNDDPPSPPPHTRGGTASPRVGRWTEAEEAYAAVVVRHFCAGALSIPSGVSLRCHLAAELRCSPMRVSTKLSMGVVGGMDLPRRLGQKRFFPMENISPSHRREVQRELEAAQSAFRRSEGLEDVPHEPSVFECSDDERSTSDGDDMGSPQRIGCWSEQEEVYAAALIAAFLHGLVDTQHGRTLRAFLAERLRCSPMRISKKLASCRMGSMVLPRRLGSATYSRQFSLFDNTELRLERLRLDCFPAASEGTAARHQDPFAVGASATGKRKPPAPVSTAAQRLHSQRVVLRLGPHEQEDGVESHTEKL